MRIRLVTSSVTLDDIDMYNTKIICQSSIPITLTFPTSSANKNESDSEIDNIGTANVTAGGKTISPDSHAHIVNVGGSSWAVVIGGGVESDPVFSASAASDIGSGDITNWDAAYVHSQSEHAPVDAQKNSDITKAEIEEKLTGVILTHTHPESEDSNDGSGGHIIINKDGNPMPQRSALMFDGNVEVTDQYGVTRVNIPYWEPITDGDPISPELLFDDDGDVIMGMVLKDEQILH